ncbi:MAG: SagB/ThcOx family dehydrogenase [Planctomycetaceae bacterium]|nr:SagB/ThcOx family dehydrogenase [Planctomycetaceae bacterium]
MHKTLFIACAFVVMGAAAAADAIRLPEPDKTGGLSLAQALAQRSSSREFADVAVSRQDIADLLWATAGVNRPDGKRVHPVAMGRQDMTVYVFTKDGAYRYDAPSHTLEPMPNVSGDNRAAAGSQPFVASAAINLVYVQDMSFWTKSDQERAAGANFGYAHAGAMMQNAYLFAATKGWAAVVRAFFDEAVLKQALGLSDTQRVRLTQSIGPEQ